MSLTKPVFIIGILLLSIYACKNKPTAKHSEKKTAIYKGLYSYGAEIKSFQPCNGKHEYWVADSSAQLELQYTQLSFEKQNEPVYVEVEGKRVPTAKDGPGSGYDTTLVVNKLIKLSKDIPKDCN
ncbi:MAG TPA: hypothetical protein VGC01_06770 [Mucilaginibacter sp.]